MITKPSNAAEAITLAATGNRALAAAGQSDMFWGHASVRDPEGRGVWMKCSGWGFEEVDEEKIVLVTPDVEALRSRRLTCRSAR
jgi:L-fuculose-phosphate aldolase